MALITPPMTTTAFAEPDQTAPVDLAQMIRVVWVGKWIIAMTTLLAVLAAGYYGFAMASPRYAASSVIDIAPALPDSADDTANPGTAIEVLLATATLQQVIDRLDLQDDPAFNRYLTPMPRLSLTGLRTRARNLLQGQPEPVPDTAAIAAKLVQNLRASLNVTHPRDSSLLRITATSGDPQQAISIANTLAAVYLADQQARKDSAKARAETWLTERSEDLRQEHGAITAAMAALTSSAGLQDPASHDQLARQLRETEALLATTEAALARSSDPANRNRLTGQSTALAASRSNLDAQLQALGAARDRLDDLQFALDTNRAEQAAHQAQLQGLAAHAGQSGARARVLNAATQAQYLGPQKILLLQIAALVGALAGLMLVALRHSLRHGLTDAQALQQLTGLPVLAQLPLLPSRRPGRLLATLDRSAAHVVSESYRHLRTALLLQGVAAPQVILSTSAIPGEGKTTQAIGLAHSLAAIGKRVLLVDADLRRGSFGRYFHLTGTDGLAAVLLGHIALPAATEPSPIPGVDLLAGSARDSNAAELMFLPALHDVLVQARGLYDCIVIDTPPVLPVPDTLALAGHADAVVFAVHWDRTPAAVVLAATQRLAAAQVQINGLTLTQVHGRKQAQRGGISFMRYGRGYFHS